MNNHGTTNNKKMEPSPTNTSARPASTRRPLSLAARQHLHLMRANGMKGPLMKTTPIAPTSVHHTKHTRSRTANGKNTTSRSAKHSSSRTAKRKAGKAKTITVTYWTHTDPSSSQVELDPPPEAQVELDPPPEAFPVATSGERPPDLDHGTDGYDLWEEIPNTSAQSADRAARALRRRQLYREAVPETPTASVVTCTFSLNLQS